MLCPFVEKFVNLSFIFVETNQNTKRTSEPKQPTKRTTDQPLNDNNTKIDKPSTKNI